MIKIELNKTFNSKHNQFNLDLKLDVKEGDLICVYGANGAGKTSFLRLLTGLDTPDFGHLQFMNETWFSSNQNINLPSQKRSIGMVFQNTTLFPNMSVRDNILFGAKPQDKNPTKRLEELVKTLELHPFLNKHPEELSGGQKQKVALARALISNPKYLFLDEPFSALDHQTRINLQDYLLRIHQSNRMTIFMVSHNFEEINKLADNIIHLEKGKVINVGPPNAIFKMNHLSGKQKTMGTITNIKKADIVYIAEVLVDQTILKIVVNDSGIINLKKGDKVLVSSKAYNPFLLKIN
ncbi:MAG: ATP-binding cassette domain-containing protein [Putridiphycobacter sp.]